jgi:hypothetical protein
MGFLYGIFGQDHDVYVGETHPHSCPLGIHEDFASLSQFPREGDCGLLLVSFQQGISSLALPDTLKSRVCLVQLFREHLQLLLEWEKGI